MPHHLHALPATAGGRYAGLILPHGRQLPAILPDRISRYLDRHIMRATP